MFGRSQFWVMVVLLVTIFPARAHGQSAQGQAAVPGADASQKPVAQDPNYVIGPQDVLDISVWKESELTRTVPVRPDGKISMPLLNDVRAAGLTPNQLAAQITMSLKKFARRRGASGHCANDPVCHLSPWIIAFVSHAAPAGTSTIKEASEDS